jgi:prophage regulatory protein
LRRDANELVFDPLCCTGGAIPVTPERERARSQRRKNAHRRTIMSVTSSIPTRKYLRAQELASMLAVHRTTLWRWVHDGHLPRPVRLGPNTVAWDFAQIDAWLAARAGLEEGGQHN